MSNVIDIHLTKLHTAQREVMAAKKRFNVINCGRRWGKTTLAVDLLMDEADGTNGAINGFPVAYFAPTYKMLADVWRDTQKVSRNIINKISEQEKRIELITGGVIDFWSLDNIDSARGRKYKRVIIDEAALIRNLKDAWAQTIRPLLSDLIGDAFFFSTPKGKGNYFFELSLMHEKHNNWSYFKMPTSRNPYIPKEEIQEAKATLDPIVFSQEYEAEFTTTNISNQFIYTLRETDRPDLKPGYAHITSGMYADSSLPVIPAFDFNVEPITCLVSQHAKDLSWISHITEYRLMNSDIFELTERVMTDYNGAYFQVTGDATGRNRTAITRGNKSYFQIIKQQMKLNDNQFKLPGKNPSIANSRVLSNAILSKHPACLINDNCRYLIDDLRFCTVDETGDIDKKKDAHKTHLLDCKRYYDWVFHLKFLNSFKRA